MSQVKEQLARHGNSLSALQSDEGFVSMEVERFQRLISCAGQKWGGEEQAKVLPLPTLNNMSKVDG